MKMSDIARADELVRALEALERQVREVRGIGFEGETGSEGDAVVPRDVFELMAVFGADYVRMELEKLGVTDVPAGETNDDRR